MAEGNATLKDMRLTGASKTFTYNGETSVPTITIVREDDSESAMLFVQVIDHAVFSHIGPAYEKIKEGYVRFTIESDTRAVTSVYNSYANINALGEHDVTNWYGSQKKYSIVVSPTYGRVNVKSFDIAIPV